MQLCCFHCHKAVLIRVSSGQPNPGCWNGTATPASPTPAENRPHVCVTAQGAQQQGCCLVVPKYNEFWGAKVLQEMPIIKIFH